MIQTILVALDDSPRAPGVLAAATELADRFDARMVLYRAITVPQEFPAAAHTSHVDPLAAMMHDKAVADLQALAQGNPRASVERPVIGSGEPWRAVIEVADRLRVDLIVIGSHGYHGLDRILGTTAGKVANHARRNVLIVHNGAHA